MKVCSKRGNNFLYQIKKQHFLYISAKVLFKGCSLEIPKDLRSKCNDNRSCHKCNTKECNNVGSAKYACIQCDSSKVSKEF